MDEDVTDIRRRIKTRIESVPWGIRLVTTLVAYIAIAFLLRIWVA